MLQATSQRTDVQLNRCSIQRSPSLPAVALFPLTRGAIRRTHRSSTSALVFILGWRWRRRGMMMLIFLSGGCGTYCRTQGTTENRTIPAPDLVPDGRTGSATQASAYGRVQSRAVCVDTGCKDDHRKHQIFCVHIDPLIVVSVCHFYADYPCFLDGIQVMGSHSIQPRSPLP